jgi:hypothetical protein
MQNFVNAGIKLLSSPQRGLRYTEETMESENEFTYDDTFAAPENTTDNMAILRSAAMQQQSTPPVPVQSLDRLSDAQRYNKFCLEAGFSGNSADFYTWLEKQTPSGPQSSSVPPVPISDTPANYSGKITVSRLVTAGVVSAVFVTAKLVCGFNKSIFLAAALYELYGHLQHAAGMGLISPETMWAFATVNGITPAMCDEAVQAQYNDVVLDHPDPERPTLAILRVFEVVMDAPTVRGLRLLLLGIKETDDTHGYGAPFRLKCLLYVVHRLVQDSLHGPQCMLIVHPFHALIDAEITGQLLTSEYFATTKVSRQRAKDAKLALDIETVNTRLDKMARMSTPLGAGRTVTKEPLAKAVRPQPVCLDHVRSPLLCSDPCPKNHLHSWPSTMPARTKEYLLGLAAKIPLPGSGGSTGGSRPESQRSQRSARPPRNNSPSSVESAVSSISHTEAPV